MMQSRGDIGQGDQTTGQPSIGSPTTKTVWHWFDFTCPFCYVARSRNEILSRSGLVIVELPFQAHPEIPAGGVTVGPRSGEMYDRLEREARDAGLPLRWPSRLPNSRYALSIAEWVRRHHPEGFTTLYYQLFLSHFSLGEDIGDTVLVDSYTEQVGADMDLIRRAISDGSADAAVVESESAACRIGLRGTPAWLIENHVVLGLQDRILFEQVAHEVADRTRDENDALRLL